MPVCGARWQSALASAVSCCSHLPHWGPLQVAAFYAAVQQRQVRTVVQHCMPFLQGDAAAWERRVYTFAQQRQLPALAAYIPTETPELRPSAYEMVLHAFLLAPGDHGRLLELVRGWPTRLYSVKALSDAVHARWARACKQGLERASFMSVRTAARGGLCSPEWMVLKLLMALLRWQRPGVAEDCCRLCVPGHHKSCREQAEAALDSSICRPPGATTAPKPASCCRS